MCGYHWNVWQLIGKCSTEMGLNNPSSVEVEGMVQADGKGRIFF